MVCARGDCTHRSVGGETADIGSTDGQKPGPLAWPGLGGPGDCSSSFRTCLRPEPEPSDAGADTRSSAAPARSLISDGEITLGTLQQRTGLWGDDGMSREWGAPPCDHTCQRRRRLCLAKRECEGLSELESILSHWPSSMSGDQLLVSPVNGKWWAEQGNNGNNEQWNLSPYHQKLL